jgi:hypothetical protein
MKLLIATVVVCALGTGRGRADNGRARADNSAPWADGVPQAQQDRANAIFAEANQLFAVQAHAPAVDKYRAALALWDHPMIRFNLAVALIRLDRILEAADELDRALRFADKPFPKELYQRALDYQALVKGRVGDVEASCAQPNVHVLLDGKPWFDCPASQKVRVMAGPHTLVGERDGFLSSSQRIVAIGGTVTTSKVELIPLEAAVKLEYPAPRWVPWTIASAGAAIALGGFGLWVSARNDMDRFSTELAAACPMGCELSTQPALADERHGALLDGNIAIGAIGTGGAVVLGGVLFAILDHPRRVLPHLEVMPSAGGMAARVGWRF